MGISSFPSPGEGVLPLLVMSTVMSVALVKNKLRSVLQVMGAAGGEGFADVGNSGSESRARWVSITRCASLCRRGCPAAGECCCVCLSGFEADEEVSELSCEHFFHKGCLDKWFGNHHSTCPLCRSIL